MADGYGHGASESSTGISLKIVNSTLTRRYAVPSKVVCLAVSTLLVWMYMYTKIYLAKSTIWKDCKSRRKVLDVVY